MGGGDGGGGERERNDSILISSQQLGGGGGVDSPSLGMWRLILCVLPGTVSYFHLPATVCASKCLTYLFYGLHIKR